MTNIDNLALPVTEEQRIKDAEHLKLLSIFHYVFGGLTVFGSSFALLHFFMGLWMIVASPLSGPEAWIGWYFTIMGALVVLCGWGAGGAMIYSGRLLAKRRRALFSQIVAGLCCLSIPFGTALGICTFLVLRRPSVKALYNPTAQGGTTLPPPPVIVDESEEQVWQDLEKRHAEQEKVPEPER